MYLFFDTETTDRRPNRARLVQLAAILSYPDGREAMSMNFIVKRPDGIPAEVVAIHHISQEISMALGHDEGTALVAFEQMVKCATIVVAHNISYDVGVMEHAYRLMDGPDAKPFDGKKLFCTKDNTTSICRLPKKGGGFKWPTLQEAYFHFFNENFDGAHNAMADVRACRDVFFAVLDHKRAERDAAGG